MSWILLGTGLYFLAGIATYRYIGWLLNVKHGEEFGQDDKDHYDGVVPMLIVMVMWPKLVFPWIWDAYRAVQEERKRKK